ncbi:unnamed protein product [Amoebophrya sp. A120]|nr:unnamed protein product [Amoebophrya sp. A120]|eukprot:GSA120T00002278001.1
MVGMLVYPLLSLEAYITLAEAAPVSFGFGSCAKQAHANQPWTELDRVLREGSFGEQGSEDVGGTTTTCPKNDDPQTNKCSSPLDREMDLPGGASTTTATTNKVPWIWLGDSAYQNTTDALSTAHLEDMFSKDNGINPWYSKFAENRTILGVWDDHDFGLNDAIGTSVPPEELKVRQDNMRAVFPDVKESDSIQLGPGLSFWKRFDGEVDLGAGARGRNHDQFSQATPQKQKYEVHFVAFDLRSFNELVITNPFLQFFYRTTNTGPVHIFWPVMNAFARTAQYFLNLFPFPWFCGWWWESGAKAKIQLLGEEQFAWFESVLEEVFPPEEFSPLRMLEEVFPPEEQGGAELLLGEDDRVDQHEKRNENNRPTSEGGDPSLVSPSKVPKLLVIGSSIQVLTSNPLFESWMHFARDKERLLALLERVKDRTLFLSGDVHFAEVNAERGFFEVTSSGITHKPFPIDFCTHLVLALWTRARWKGPNVQHNFGGFSVNEALLVEKLHQKHAAERRYQDELTRVRRNEAVEMEEMAEAKEADAATPADNTESHQPKDSVLESMRAEAHRPIVIPYTVDVFGLQRRMVGTTTDETASTPATASTASAAGATPAKIPVQEWEARPILTVTQSEWAQYESGRRKREAEALRNRNLITVITILCLILGSKLFLKYRPHVKFWWATRQLQRRQEELRKKQRLIEANATLLSSSSRKDDPSDDDGNIGGAGTRRGGSSSSSTSLGGSRHQAARGTTENPPSGSRSPGTTNKHNSSSSFTSTDRRLSTTSQIPTRTGSAGTTLLEDAEADESDMATRNRTRKRETGRPTTPTAIVAATAQERIRGNMISRILEHLPDFPGVRRRSERAEPDLHARHGPQLLEAEDLLSSPDEHARDGEDESFAEEEDARGRTTPAGTMPRGDHQLQQGTRRIQEVAVGGSSNATSPAPVGLGGLPGNRVLAAPSAVGSNQGGAGARYACQGGMRKRGASPERRQTASHAKPPRSSGGFGGGIG